jgi:tRNA(Ile)-lysidine synthase
MSLTETVFSVDVLGQILFDELRAESSAHLLVAYSGGMDSHVLLHATAKLRDQYAITVSALHADHGIVPESVDWVRHCRRVCDALNIEFRTSALALDRCGDSNLEARARSARYGWLSQAMLPGQILLTGHTQDDQAETVVLRLLRGSGLRGMGGIRESREFADGRLLRPLLRFDRVSLHSYARSHGLTWIEDPSNNELHFDRNIVRHRVLPVLRDRWPHAAASIARSARHLDRADTVLQKVTRADIEACTVDPGGAVLARHPVLSAQCLQSLPRARAELALRLWVGDRGYPVPGARLIDEIFRQLSRPGGALHGAVSWSGVAIRRYRGRMYLDGMSAIGSGFDRQDWSGDAPLLLGALGVRLVPKRVQGRGISMDYVDAMTVRGRCGGERCRLPQRHHRHTVKHIYQAFGVPPWERQRLPLLYRGDEVVAIPGVLVCAPFAARPGESGIAICVKPIVSTVRGQSGGGSKCSD